MIVYPIPLHMRVPTTTGPGGGFDRGRPRRLIVVAIREPDDSPREGGYLVCPD